MCGCDQGSRLAILQRFTLTLAAKNSSRTGGFGRSHQSEFPRTKDRRLDAADIGGRKCGSNTSAGGCPTCADSSRIVGGLRGKVGSRHN